MYAQWNKIKHRWEWNGPVRDLVNYVARSDARLGFVTDLKSGAKIAMNIDSAEGSEPFYIESADGDDLYDAENRKEAIKILNNIRRGKEFPDMNPLKVKRKNPLSRYESDEVDRYLAEVNEIEKAPLQERKEYADEWYEAIKNRPQLVADRIGWLLNGSYGQGSYLKAHQVLGMSKRANKVANLAIMLAGMEWRTPAPMAIAKWKKLSKSEQQHINRLIQKEIDEYIEEYGVDDKFKNPLKMKGGSRRNPSAMLPMSSISSINSNPSTKSTSNLTSKSGSNNLLLLGAIGVGAYLLIKRMQG